MSPVITSAKEIKNECRMLWYLIGAQYEGHTTNLFKSKTDSKLDILRSLKKNPWRWENGIMVIVMY